MNCQNVSVVVITRNRPSILKQCLERLFALHSQPGQILVIDSSSPYSPLPDLDPRVEQVKFPAGRGQMPRARNEGTRRSRGEVVAFLDDDCLADPDWLDQIVAAYREDPCLAGVGGRISDPRWSFDPALPVGKVTPNGEIYANFFGDPGGVQNVDILPGGNMSFRKDWLLRVGGFDPGYVATNHREDPDLCLRIRGLGGKLAYQPAAHALHLNARNSLGELKKWHEFYLRYSFARNEAFFLARHFPHRVWIRWLADSWKQLQTGLRARSLVALACVPVVTLSYGLGLLAQKLEARRRK